MSNKPPYNSNSRRDYPFDLKLIFKKLYPLEYIDKNKEYINEQLDKIQKTFPNADNNNYVQEQYNLYKEDQELLHNLGNQTDEEIIAALTRGGKRKTRKQKKQLKKKPRKSKRKRVSKRR